uniref:Photosystem II 10 kDa polypeptide, chloroplastic n=1 Tax=Rhizophora mucronata TaxID=61149 RepID=A0A2P2K0Q2_RHIMU
MAATVMTSLSLKPAPWSLEKSSSSVRALPTLPRRSFRVEASKKAKLNTDKPYGISGGMNLRDGLDASGRKGKGKGVYQFVDKYGANVDGYR